MAIDATSSVTAQMTANSTTKSSSQNNMLSMEDFFSLMVAQLSNQDMNNPVDNSQFITQMAQFSMVQALSEMKQASTAAYSVSLIGKEGTVAQIDDDGFMHETIGIIEGVNLYNGNTEVIIDGNSFPLSSIMKLAEPKIIIPNPTVTDEAGAEEAVEKAEATDRPTENEVEE